MARLTMPVSALALCLAATAAPAQQVKVGPVLYHWGTCEASGAVPYPPNSFGDRFLVVDDENNVVRLYKADESGAALALKRADLGKHLGLQQDDDDKKADFEGAAWLGNDLFLIGSHSRRKGGKLSPSRSQLAAITVTGAGRDELALDPKGAAYHGLHKAFAALGPLLSERIGLEAKEQEDLDPKRKGFNIEGLAARPDGASLWIGLRNPLSPDGDAMVVAFENPGEVVASGAAPRLGAPVTLDLKGRGIRDIAYVPAAKSYYVVAGPSGGGGEPFDLYRWSGEAGAAPTRVPGAAAAFAAIPDFQPEAVLPNAAGDRVQVLSDDGDAVLKDGSKDQKCEDAKRQRRFRSVVLDLR
ncbi:hypothetical protein OPKNFCMD_3767 [Methylobacterium crusticola]|uniref:Phytase-like domain-containing protein n=1 Tax=Methylobacterium crusticola TaxID=1697972 RepID=A0ABQ4R045_9HYPH|nr:DUF3616 domain-containing protein [Methylobacterium crusticola]GJD51016.1 hypothetical protein OPKNFCMD_3767 [Methylobacterium crusticola]